jgi:hypothetical protein
VLRQDSSNPDALGGLRLIEDKYIGWIRSSIVSSDIARVRRLLARLAKIAPHHPQLPELKESYTDLQLGQSGNVSFDSYSAGGNSASHVNLENKTVIRVLPLIGLKGRRASSALTTFALESFPEYQEVYVTDRPVSGAAISISGRVLSVTAKDIGSTVGNGAALLGGLTQALSIVAPMTIPLGMIGSAATDLGTSVAANTLTMNAVVELRATNHGSGEEIVATGKGKAIFSKNSSSDAIEGAKIQSQQRAIKSAVVTLNQRLAQRWPGVLGSDVASATPSVGTNKNGLRNLINRLKNGSGETDAQHKKNRLWDGH